MKQHFNTCLLAADSIPQPGPIAADSMPQPVPQKRQRDDSPPPTKRQACESTTVQPQVTNYTVRTSANDKQSIDEEIAKLFYSCNIPFNVAEHPQFKSVIEKLRPGYTPPTRKAIAGPLLDKVTSKLQSKMKSEISGKAGTLVEDGWSTVHNEPVIASCLVVEGKPYFLDSHDTGTMTKTAVNCKNLAQKSINLAMDQFNCKVDTLVTDNAKNMERMREELKEDNPDVIAYGCSSHVTNLLGQDITPSGIMKHVTEIQKFFRNHHLPAAWLKEAQGSHKPQIPGETRWNSQLECLDSYINNRSHYLQIIHEHENECKWDENVVRKINDYALYKNAKDLTEQLRPVACALDKLQSDSTSIADACDIWMDLKSNPKLEPHQSAVSKRFRLAIRVEHLVAYTLHPKYQGQKLSTEQLDDVNKWLVNKDPCFITTLISFQAKAAPFPDSYFAEHAVNMPPSTWWKAAGNYGVNQDFVKLACQLLSAPASSASIERIFSNFSYIFNKLRNRLGLVKASKLVFCYRMLRGTTEVDWD